jgi:N-acetylglucosaminyl-diphospho-decaprenol L-rhamnosyltransferase
VASRVFEIIGQATISGSMTGHGSRKSWLTSQAFAMDLSIIIVNWKSKDYLRKCLASVFAELYPFTYEVIVIDSASFDGCGEMLRSEFPQVHFIQSETNLGFAKANNRASRAASGTYLLFLNPDTEVIGPAIAELYRALDRLPRAGAVGAKLLNTDNTIQTSCIQAFPTILNQLLNAELLRRYFPRSRLWGMAPIFEVDQQPREVEAISGACVMLPRWLFHEVGDFSEDYFMYAEDIDLSYKVSRAGYTRFYVPAATVIHHGGGSSANATSNFSNVMMCDSVWRYFKKTRGKGAGVLYRSTMFGTGLIRLCLLIVLFPWAKMRLREIAWHAAFRKWRAVTTWSMKGARGWSGGQPLRDREKQSVNAV